MKKTKNQKTYSQTENSQSSLAIIGLVVLALVWIFGFKSKKDEPVVSEDDLEIAAVDEIETEPQDEAQQSFQTVSAMKDRNYDRLFPVNKPQKKVLDENLKNEDKPQGEILLTETVQDLNDSEPQQMNLKENTSTDYYFKPAGLYVKSVNYKELKKIPMPGFDMSSASGAFAFPNPDFSPDGSLFVVSGMDTARVYDSITLQQIKEFRFYGRSIVHAAIDASKSRIAFLYKPSGYGDQVAGVFDLNSKAMIDYMPLMEGDSFQEKGTVKWVSAESIYIQNSGGEASEWYVTEKKKSRFNLKSGCGLPQATEFSQFILLSPSFPGWKSTHTTFQFSPGYTVACLFSFSYYDTGDKKFHTWNQKFELNPDSKISFNPVAVSLTKDYSGFYVLSDKGELYFRNIATNSIFNLGPIYDQEGRTYKKVKSMEISPDGTMLLLNASATNGKLLLLDPNTMEAVTVLEEADKSPYAWARFSPDGQFITGGTESGKVSLWKAQ